MQYYVLFPASSADELYTLKIECGKCCTSCPAHIPLLLEWVQFRFRFELVRDKKMRLYSLDLGLSQLKIGCHLGLYLQGEAAFSLAS